MELPSLCRILEEVDDITSLASGIFMATTYDAILRNNHLEWGASSPVIAPDESLRVKVTVVGADVTLREPERQAKIIQALEELAAQGGIQGIPDPVAWQRDVRADRELPGR